MHFKMEFANFFNIKFAKFKTIKFIIYFLKLI